MEEIWLLLGLFYNITLHFSFPWKDRAALQSGMQHPDVLGVVRLQIMERKPRDDSEPGAIFRLGVAISEQVFSNNPD